MKEYFQGGKKRKRKKKVAYWSRRSSLLNVRILGLKQILKFATSLKKQGV
jgi:hypothetical protein